MAKKRAKKKAPPAPRRRRRSGSSTGAVPAAPVSRVRSRVAAARSGKGGTTRQATVGAVAQVVEAGVDYVVSRWTEPDTSETVHKVKAAAGVGAQLMGAATGNHDVLTVGQVTTAASTAVLMDRYGATHRAEAEKKKKEKEGGGAPPSGDGKSQPGASGMPAELVSGGTPEEMVKSVLGPNYGDEIVSELRDDNATAYVQGLGTLPLARLLLDRLGKTRSPSEQATAVVDTALAAEGYPCVSSGSGWEVRDMTGAVLDVPGRRAALARHMVASNSETGRLFDGIRERKSARRQERSRREPQRQRALGRGGRGQLPPPVAEADVTYLGDADQVSSEVEALLDQM